VEEKAKDKVATYIGGGHSGGGGGGHSGRGQDR
jgi:hypothetical protein